jgi:hypothetical protein
MNAPLKADVTAADRLLKAAVRRAVEEMSSWPAVEPLDMDREDVVAMLTAAGTAVELLLGEATS